MHKSESFLEYETPKILGNFEITQSRPENQILWS